MPTLPAHEYAKNGQLKELEEYLNEHPSFYVNLKDDTYVSIILSLLLLLLLPLLFPIIPPNIPHILIIIIITILSIHVS